MFTPSYARSETVLRHAMGRGFIPLLLLFLTAWWLPGPRHSGAVPPWRAQPSWGPPRAVGGSPAGTGSPANGRDGGDPRAAPRRSASRLRLLERAALPGAGLFQREVGPSRGRTQSSKSSVVTPHPPFPASAATRERFQPTAMGRRAAGCSQGTGRRRSCARKRKGEGSSGPAGGPPPQHRGAARWLANPLQAQDFLVGEASKEWKNHHTHCTDGKSLQPSSLPHPRGVNYTDRCTIWEVVQIFFFIFFFNYFFFLRKRDAKTTLAVPCLVLGFQCWLRERRNRHSWQAVNDPDRG